MLKHTLTFEQILMYLAQVNDMCVKPSKMRTAMLGTLLCYLDQPYATLPYKYRLLFIAVQSGSVDDRHRKRTLDRRHIKDVVSQYLDGE